MTTKQEEATRENPRNAYVLLWGLKSEDGECTLAPGVTMRSLVRPLTVFDLAGAGTAGFRQWALLEPIAPACVAEIESAKDSDTTPGYDALNRAWLACALLVLRGYTRHMGVAASGYSWNVVAGQNAGEYGKLPPFTGNILDFHLRLISNKRRKNSPITKDDASWVGAHFETFNRLAAESQQFRFALEAAIDWRYSKDERAAISRLWAGIESLFDIKTELVYRLSLFCACLLAKRGKERTQKFRQVRDLYNLRSKAVHGEQLDDDKLADAVDGSFEILSSLLLNCISRGRVPNAADLDHAVFED